jgi:hypothetical protein
MNGRLNRAAVNAEATVVRGSGFTVIYGVAAPVKTPLLGTVRKP